MDCWRKIRGAMTMATNDRLGCDELRIIVRNMDATTEGFNQRYSVRELVQIGRMLLQCEHDYLPDTWSNRQVREALNGRPPTWDPNGEPTYQENELVGKKRDK